MSLSDRIRPNSEAAPWVCEEVKKLELKLAAMSVELETMTNIAKAVPSLGSAHQRMEKAEKKLAAIYTVWGTVDADRLMELKDYVYEKCAQADAELADERAMAALFREKSRDEESALHAEIMGLKHQLAAERANRIEWAKAIVTSMENIADDNPDHWASDESRKSYAKLTIAVLREEIEKMEKERTSQ